MLAYTVTCEVDDPAVAEEYLAWLSGGHLAAVCAAGALDAEVVRLDGDAIRIETRYHFASPEAFAAYERDHAAELRQDGLARFPPERGMRFVRSVGETVARHPTSP